MSVAINLSAGQKISLVTPDGAMRRVRIEVRHIPEKKKTGLFRRPLPQPHPMIECCFMDEKGNTVVSGGCSGVSEMRDAYACEGLEIRLDEIAAPVHEVVLTARFAEGEHTHFGMLKSLGFTLSAGHEDKPFCSIGKSGQYSFLKTIRLGSLIRMGNRWEFRAENR